MTWLELYSIAVRHPRARGMLSDVAAAAVLDRNDEALSREVLTRTHDSLRLVCEVLDKHAVPLPTKAVDLVGALSTRGPKSSRRSET